ncbi:MAG: alpha/beta hydrolase [Halioglobus sp.]
MDVILAGLALFNLGSMVTIFLPRSVRRKAVPWATFAFALLATELAWIWLPLQALFAWMLINGGALDSSLGVIALCILVVSWCGLVWSVWMAYQARPAVEYALRAALGQKFRDDILPERRLQLRDDVRFSDWRNPIETGHPEVEVLRDIPYQPGGIRQHLDIYRPREIPEQGCPVLLQIHGGAWMMGDKTHQALPLMHLLAARGWICVAVNYRLSPSVGFPTHLEDCKSALCWIREEGHAYGMDTSFVAVTGGSAGGHLAALMGLTANDPQFQINHPGVDTSVQACVPFYGLYDFLVRFEQHPNRKLYEDFVTGRVLHQSRGENPALWDLASPVTHIHSGAPPFMVVHGALDSLATVSDARVFSQKLRKVSENPVAYVELPGAEHAFDIFHSPRTEFTINGVHQFLEWARSR